MGKIAASHIQAKKLRKTSQKLIVVTGIATEAGNLEENGKQ
jgi:hypothetical protein